MIEGIFGGSLIVELLIAYIIIQLAYEKTPNKWLYALAIILSLNFLTHMTSVDWMNLFLGQFEFVWR
ncbi:MAG: hypothetical protein IPJ89_05660 [Candidatus Iainarchaeum archaeon]|uniref:Uncharacterized protein n=1 Tax=Candidatus Iainarchaeum sp. TaxID=3101447 RepID=A0A7T9I1R1_9ARCH|nr:MAG: hypothetical protein IPJ89_05660 [Candidatus Diapherotrites archaeon]